MPVNTSNHLGTRIPGSNIFFTERKVSTATLQAGYCDGKGVDYQGSFVDTNGNGKYDWGKDSVIISDTNKDGKYDTSDVTATSKMLQQMKRGKATGLDSDGDGKLTGRDANARSLRVARDLNGDGKYTANELVPQTGLLGVEGRKAVVATEVKLPSMLDAAGYVISKGGPIGVAGDMLWNAIF